MSIKVVHDAKISGPLIGDREAFTPTEHGTFVLEGIFRGARAVDDHTYDVDIEKDDGSITSVRMNEEQLKQLIEALKR